MCCVYLPKLKCIGIYGHRCEIHDKYIENNTWYRHRQLWTILSCPSQSLLTWWRTLKISLPWLPLWKLYFHLWNSKRVFPADPQKTCMCRIKVGSPTLPCFWPQGYHLACKEIQGLNPTAYWGQLDVGLPVGLVVGSSSWTCRLSSEVLTHLQKHTMDVW